MILYNIHLCDIRADMLRVNNVHRKEPLTRVPRTAQNSQFRLICDDVVLIC